MKRRGITGKKGKNRINEVDVPALDREASPLESPYVDDSAPTYRRLADRRANRDAHSDSDAENNEDDDELENDSGDEGLMARRRNLLAGGTASETMPSAPSASSAQAPIAPTSKSITTTATKAPNAPAVRSTVAPNPSGLQTIPSKPELAPLGTLKPDVPTDTVSSPNQLSPRQHRRDRSVSFSAEILLEAGEWKQTERNNASAMADRLDSEEATDEATPLVPFRNAGGGGGGHRSFSYVPTHSLVVAQGNDDQDNDGNKDDISFHSEADSTAVGGEEEQEDGTNTVILSIFEQIEEGTAAMYETITETIQEVTTEAWEQYDESRHYDWREFWKGGGILKFCRWLATGMAPENVKQSDDEIQDNLNSLARMLSLLREYHERFGMPEMGGYKDQEYVLREVTKDLYSGGSPIWALEPVMKRVAEGLTGKSGVDFFMLPRRAFIFAPSSGATAMFRINRGYDMQRLDDMESVAVRLASFASNTSSVASVAARWPKAQEMRRAFRTESLAGCYYSREEMSEEILNLAADAEGLFYYIRNHQSKCYANRESPLYAKGADSDKLSELGEFWTVEEEIRELFSRLAAVEAARAIDKLDIERKPLYSRSTVVLFRVLSSSCACAFWFNGSWVDILVSGALAEVVAMIGNSPILSKQERIIFEAVASFVVGFVAACIALTWPGSCCFGAIAISGVLDLLQGFRVVYSIIEIMSRHTVTGGADFLEGIFFTTLIAYCLQFGQYAALESLGKPETDEYMQCNNRVSEWWFLLFVPLGAVAWSGLFNPNYFDLPIMAAHGVLGYLVSWQFSSSANNIQLNNLLAAMTVTFSSGILSRFTGRQALGNTVAGLYVLLPGAYLVTQVYTDHIDGFLWQIILRAIIIGIGAWTGTILCTPTLLGINRGLMEYSKAVPSLVENGSISDNLSTSSSVASGQNFRRRDKAIRKNGTGRLLFF